MTKRADFKRLVRQRMKETGENYTTARAAMVSNRCQHEWVRVICSDGELEVCRRCKERRPYREAQP